MRNCKAIAGYFILLSSSILRPVMVLSCRLSPIPVYDQVWLATQRSCHSAQSSSMLTEVLLLLKNQALYSESDQRLPDKNWLLQCFIRSLCIKEFLVVCSVYQSVSDHWQAEVSVVWMYCVNIQLLFAVLTRAYCWYWLLYWLSVEVCLQCCN